MASAGWALQKAVYAALSGDTALTARIGTNQVFDDVPRDAEFPYVAFGPTVERDWSTGSEVGREHAFVLHVWSRHSGRRETVEVMDAVRAALHDQSLILDGHRLINLRHEMSEVRRDEDGETYQGIVRFRAVTEPEI